MLKTTGLHGAVSGSMGRVSRVVSQAGGVLLLRTAAAVGSGRRPVVGRWPGGGVRRRSMIRGRCCWTWRWRSPWAGTAWPISLSCGSSRRCSGRSRRIPTVSRLVDRAGSVTSTWRSRRSTGRGPRPAARAWTAAGTVELPDHGVDGDRPLVLDVDATLVTAHSEKERARPTFKKGLRLPPAAGVRRPRGRPGRVSRWPGSSGRGTPGRTPPTDHIAGRRATRWRSLPGHQVGTAPCGTEGPGPRGRRRWDARVPGLADRPPVVLFDRVHPDREP